VRRWCPGGPPARCTWCGPRTPGGCTPSPRRRCCAATPAGSLKKASRRTTRSEGSPSSNGRWPPRDRSPGLSSGTGSPRPGYARSARHWSTCSCWRACEGSRYGARWPGASTPTRWSGTGSARRPAGAARARPPPALPAPGPATERDLAKWAGLPLGDARRGLAAIAGRLADRDDGLADLAARHGVAGGEPPLPPPRLLGAFDPVLLGWASREPIVGPHGRLVAINGLFRPFAMVGGRAVGTWGMPAGKVALTPWAPLPEAGAAARAADAAEVERFLGGPAGSAGDGGFSRAGPRGSSG